MSLPDAGAAKWMFLHMQMCLRSAHAGLSDEMYYTCDHAGEACVTVT